MLNLFESYNSACTARVMVLCVCVCVCVHACIFPHFLPPCKIEFLTRGTNRVDSADSVQHAQDFYNHEISYTSYICAVLAFFPILCRA